MNFYNLSAAIFRLSKLQCADAQAWAACVQRFLQLPRTPTRSLSNVIYALCLAPPAIKQQHAVTVQQQLLPAFVASCAGANAQDISNVMYGMATSGQQLPEEAVQQLLTVFVCQQQDATPQTMSNTLWAVATMGQQVSAGQLQQLLDAFLGKLQQANSQNVSNTLLACAKLGFLPQQLLAAPGMAGLLLADTPQGLANAAWACGQLGHRDEQLIGALLADAQQRLVASNHIIGGFNSQTCCNACWAVSVLDLQQHAQQVLQLAQACSSIWSNTVEEGQQQLWQVHSWLLDFQLAGGQGLQGSLTQQQLQQCRAAWDRAAQKAAGKRHTEFQRSVFAAVQRLPIAWQQPPQMEQLGVGRDGVTPDGALLLDIAGRTADGVLVAVEADGPWHFRQPDGGLMGTTQYRNRALAVRGYVLVIVPVGEWAQLRGGEQRQAYLMRLFKEAGVLQPDQPAYAQQQPEQQQQSLKQRQGGKVRASAQALLRRAGLQRQAMPADSAQQPPPQRRRRTHADSS